MNQFLSKACCTYIWWNECWQRKCTAGKSKGREHTLHFAPWNIFALKTIKGLIEKSILPTTEGVFKKKSLIFFLSGFMIHNTQKGFSTLELQIQDREECNFGILSQLEPHHPEVLSSPTEWCYLILQVELGEKKLCLDWVGTVIRNVDVVHQTMLMILNRSTYQRRAKNVQKKKFIVEICLLHRGLLKFYDKVNSVNETVGTGNL